MKRAPVLAIAVVLVVAVASFVAFNTLNQPAANPAVAPTPVATLPIPTFIPPVRTPPDPNVNPTPVPWTPPAITPVGTPLTTKIDPTEIPKPTIPSPPEITPFPPNVTNWIPFQGVKTGFSFSYPAGWSVRENSTLAPAYSPDPQVVIYITNYDFEKAPARGGSPLPGALKIEIQNLNPSPPQGGTPFAVGFLQLPGHQFVYQQPSSGLDRTIAIHFPIATKQWSVFGYIAQHLDASTPVKNAEIFYKIIGSLRYETR